MESLTTPSLADEDDVAKTRRALAKERRLLLVVTHGTLAAPCLTRLEVPRMRTTQVFLHALVLGTLAWPAAAQSPGTYVSSIDHKRYELRSRGETGLDIYTASGELVAVLNRKKASEPFKGKTQTLASRCPNNAGKIETVANLDDRIRMRVEVPQMDIRKRMSCNMLVLSDWQPFDLVRESGPERAAGAAPSAELADGGDEADRAVVDLASEKVDFHVDVVAAGSGELTVKLSALNHGDDRFLTLGARPYNYGWCHLYHNGPGIQLSLADGEQGATTKYDNPIIRIGDERLQQIKFNTGDKVVATLHFKELKTSRGLLKTDTMKRLDVGVSVGDKDAKKCDILSFRAVPIQPAK
jgi:hypothetical protein